MKDKITQMDLVKEYFVNNPNRNIEHPEVVDWVVAEWNKRTGGIFRDPDRAIRSLSQRGFLIKISKGVYKYDPDFVVNRELENFTPEQRGMILERDGFRCVICGRWKQDGVELHIDHIKPKDLGGKATLENGQTLCAQHNFKKKNYNQTETGKKLFINLYDLAKSLEDTELLSFCSQILDVYEKNGINGHIKWNK